MGSAFAQSPTKDTNDIRRYSITGSVVDVYNNLPLNSVNLTLTTEQGTMISRTATMEDGSFSINVTNKGTYKLVMSFMGYKNYTSELILLNSDSLIELGRITLEHDFGMLEEIVVSSRKATIQNKGDKIIYNASADIGNKSGSASDVLRKAPMVTVGANGEVKMRGSSNIKVLLNGMPSGILAKNLKEALKMIPASTIESIEVITTPSAKYEAEGAAGIINIITKKKTRGTNGNLDINGGNLEQSFNGGLNVASGKFNFNLSLNASNERERVASELYRESFTDGKETGRLFQRSDAIQKDRGIYGDFAAEFRPDSTQKISATLSYWQGNWPSSASIYNLYEGNQQISQYNQNSNQSAKYRFWDIGLNYQKKYRKPGQELLLVAQISNTVDNANYKTDQFYLSGQHYFRETSPNKGNSRDVNLQADYSHPLNSSGSNNMEAGVRYTGVSSLSEFTVFNNINNPGSPGLIEDISRSDRMDYFQNIFAGYLSFRIQTKNNWAFRPGARYESTRLGGDFRGPSSSFKANFGNLVPSLLISKKLNDHHDIKLNYTERIRRPWIWDLNPYVNASDPRNLTYGNPELRPEITKMFEAGHSYTSASGFSLNSSMYFNSNSNAIEMLTSVDSLGISRTTSQNIASNRRLGTNIIAYMEVTKNLSLNAGAEFYHVWFKSNAMNVAKDASFYSVNLNTTYMFPKDYSIQASGDYSNGYITLQGNTTADFSYRFSFRKEFLDNKASFTLGINNPFQTPFLQRSYAQSSTFKSNTSSRYYNRSFALSFSWRFGSSKSKSDNEDDDDMDRQDIRKGRKK